MGRPKGSKNKKTEDTDADVREVEAEEKENDEIVEKLESPEPVAEVQNELRTESSGKTAKVKIDDDFEGLVGEEVDEPDDWYSVSNTVEKPDPSKLGAREKFFETPGGILFIEAMEKSDIKVKDKDGSYVDAHPLRGTFDGIEYRNGRPIAR